MKSINYLKLLKFILSNKLHFNYFTHLSILKILILFYILIYRKINSNFWQTFYQISNTLIKSNISINVVIPII
jgi:hypothetical protein